MKKLILVLVIFCSCEKDDPGLQMGCQSGVNIYTGEREFIRCTDVESYNCGSNDNCKWGDSGIGREMWDQYQKQRWTPVSDCSECQTMDYSKID